MYYNFFYIRNRTDGIIEVAENIRNTNQENWDQIEEDIAETIKTR